MRCTQANLKISGERRTALVDLVKFLELSITRRLLVEARRRPQKDRQVFVEQTVRLEKLLKSTSEGF